ncbi:E3 ubiquitin-protein ligase RSL1-like [Diospyros lotus]|uniref:E3 ubiquitin-protein ligase RSL1-like n=1 Tax=Diospyros lotus TaxID=55363 RepID=UPI00224D28D2|nr:E3 ubiquitin-protein ligase RSL1-like [Diospyros lotus]
MGNANGKGSRQRQEPELELPEFSTFTCEVCVEPTPPESRFKNNATCVHQFCTNCVARYIQVKVEDDRAANVKCPAPNCHHMLDAIYCRPIIGRRVFDAWCDVLCDNALLGLDRCYCPNQECSAVVVNECGANVKRSECPNCERPFCFQCKLPWHAGYRCGEARDGNDTEFGILAEERNWIRCPECNHYVELIEGCSFVRCRCGTKFCYECGRKVHFVACDGGWDAERWIWPLGLSSLLIFCLTILLLFLIAKFRSNLLAN